MSTATIRMTAAIPETKRGFSGLPVKGYNQYEITFTGLKEFGLPYEKTFTFRHTLDGRYFAVAGRDWTARSFSELFKSYNTGSKTVHSISSRMMLFDSVIFTDDEVKQGLALWAELSGEALEEEVVVAAAPAIVAPVEETVIAPVEEVVVPPVEEVVVAPVEEVPVEEIPAEVNEVKEEVQAQPAAQPLPQFRNKQLIRQAHVNIRIATQWLKKIETRFAKQAHAVGKQEMKTEASRPGTVARARAEEKLARERELVEQFRMETLQAVRDRDHELARLQAIEALPEEPANYVSMEEKYPEERSEPASVAVRLLSGDLFWIDIDLNDEMHFFPKHFAREAGYNPSVVSRMVFFVEDEEEALIDPDQPSEIITEHITWKEHFADIPNPDALPMLNLFIRPESEKDRAPKITLLRQILEQKKLNDAIDDTELYSHYSEWYLRYQPPAVSNRYITMSAFIEQNPHLFPVLTEEEQVAARERKEHRRMLEDFGRFRKRELTWVDDHIAAYGDRFNVPRLAVHEELRQLVAVAAEQGTELVFNPEQHRYFLHWMTIPEIIAIGVRSENICACPHALTCFVANWERLSAELDALH